MAADLTRRAQQQAQERQQQTDTPTVKALIWKARPEIERALPKHMDADRLARMALNVVSATPALAECDPYTFIGALLTASQLGLEPGPLGEAYLVPYGRKVQFIPGYRGLVKLAYQSGMVDLIEARIVHEGDEFDYAFGLDPFLTHKPAAGDDAKMSHAYAVIRLKGVSRPLFDVMRRAEVEAVRARSRAKDNGPWMTDYEAMARKTVLKRLVKWAPLSSELRNVALASELDESYRTNIGGAVDEQPARFVDVDVPQGQIAAPPAEAEPKTGRGKAQRSGRGRSEAPAVDQSTGEVHEPQKGTQGREPEPSATEPANGADQCPICGASDGDLHDEAAHNAAGK